MNYSILSIALHDRIKVVTINRPEKLNALNRQTLDELSHAFKDIESDSNLLAVILTGAGEKAFVAGADIGEFTSLNALGGQAFARYGQGVFLQIERCPKPVIAAVNGFALGGGCELAMACHIRLASENAKFGQPEVNLGIIPGYGGTQRLPRLVGQGRALELILSGAMIDAQEAFRIGLVNKVVPREELMSTTLTMAGVICGKAPVAVQSAIEAVTVTSEMGLEEGLTHEAALFGLTCGTSDFQEGASAFLEKRTASFQGR